jgi:Trk K+ transport system NAD-binding subunit
VLTPAGLAADGGVILQAAADGSVLASGPNPGETIYTIEAVTSLPRITAVRLEALPDPSLPKGGPGRDPYGNFQMNGFDVDAGGGPLAIKSIRADEAAGGASVETFFPKVLPRDAYFPRGWRIDASRDETLEAAHVERASALLVSAGRDDSAILIVLTARKLASELNISVTIREADNEDIARQAGADTVINPVSFAGLLLASSLHGPYRAEYLADLATSEGRVELRERIVEPDEVGRSLREICTGQAVRLIRDGKAHAPSDPSFQRLAPGDRILEIIDSA